MNVDIKIWVAVGFGLIAIGAIGWLIQNQLRRQKSKHIDTSSSTELPKWDALWGGLSSALDRAKTLADLIAIPQILSGLKPWEIEKFEQVLFDEERISIRPYADAACRRVVSSVVHDETSEVSLDKLMLVFTTWRYNDSKTRWICLHNLREVFQEAVDIVLLRQLEALKKDIESLSREICMAKVQEISAFLHLVTQEDEYSKGEIRLYRWPKYHNSERQKPSDEVLALLTSIRFELYQSAILDAKSSEHAYKLKDTFCDTKYLDPGNHVQAIRSLASEMAHALDRALIRNTRPELPLCDEPTPVPAM
jgi:hypothetical protein